MFSMSKILMNKKVRNVGFCDFFGAFHIIFSDSRLGYLAVNH